MPTCSEAIGRASALLRVRGVVQGVGFRPFVYKIATRFGINGWVKNDGEGVLVAASGTPESMGAFLAELRSRPPAAARIDAIEELVYDEGECCAGFAIAASDQQAQRTTLVSPDLAICADCLRELNDPHDRRYHYPYINCTNCGPRYSIIVDLPYDRPLTTMAAFAMCPACASEYSDPLDRRFHAQPVACPECGPQVRYFGSERSADACSRAAIKCAVRDLLDGKILAIKGLGGYHLACDAANSEAVTALRRRKHRQAKPFALMAGDVAALEGYVTLDKTTVSLLESSARPIVLAPKGVRPLPAEVAQDSADLGVMLPYTPLQHLLFAEGAPKLMVMTSANLASEPIVFKDADALTRLATVADSFVTGSRPIHRRIDDSVATVIGGAPTILRRARGYAPAPAARSPRFDRPILALGAGLKNTVTLAALGNAFVSQHLGDLDTLEAVRAFEQTAFDLLRMYRIDVGDTLVVHDLHPDYASTRLAFELEAHEARRLAVPHHQAHIASVLAEKDCWQRPVIGFSFDGAGLGEDGTVWGGELFHGSLEQGLIRVGHLLEAHLPGGDAAARRPAQAAVGFLREFDPERYQAYLPERIVSVATGLIRSGINSPVTTSMGRLFDAVSALTGYSEAMTFEGQAAMRLEMLARQAPPCHPYPFPFDGTRLDHRPLFDAILRDLDIGVPRETVARRFHMAVAQAVADAAASLRQRHGSSTVVLSGGVWQNRLLHQRALTALHECGFEVWWNQTVPPGDGGVSLGQAALAAAGRS